MKKRIVLFVVLCCSVFVSKVQAQELGMYAFSRKAELVNHSFKSQKTTYIDGVSAGLGLYKESLFVELGAILLEGNAHAIYTYFGKTIKTVDLGNSIRVNSSLFGQVDNVPVPNAKDAWIYTTGVAVYPNVQIKNINIGLALTTGLAHQDKEVVWNSRMVLNMMYTLF